MTYVQGFVVFCWLWCHYQVTASEKEIHFSLLYESPEDSEALQSMQTNRHKPQRRTNALPHDPDTLHCRLSV